MEVLIPKVEVHEPPWSHEQHWRNASSSPARSRRACGRLACGDLLRFVVVDVLAGRVPCCLSGG
jgi:hypothetical protein